MVYLLAIVSYLDDFPWFVFPVASFSVLFQINIMISEQNRDEIMGNCVI